MAVINRERLDRELLRRGLNVRRFSVLSGVSESTLCHARKGRGIAPETLRAIDSALVDIPPLTHDLIGAAS